jgi:AraC-like DNA-binding protein
LSSTIAKKSNFLNILAKNYLTLSKIEESKGHIQNAFEYYKKYANLKDSIFNTKNFGDINQLQRLYEVSKTNQQIEQLAIEQQIKEHTIHYQKVIQFITLSVLLLAIIILLYIAFQKRMLNTAYKTLFKKNLEIIDLLNSVENQPKKYEKSTLTDNLQNELLKRILTIMEDTSIICDTEFTMDRLSELAQSNPTYVSQVINSTLQKNFRSLLNSYRIREAQRLFSESEAIYTIEFVAAQVGFKSQNAFRKAFKEVTGMNPNFYVKEILEMSNNFNN